MCGISGILNIKLNNYNNDINKHINVMNYLQRHRGPDGNGIWNHDNNFIGLGHVRLSIIDLSTGQQPMSSKNGNVITYNGEIYNYLEIRKILQGKGYHFDTTSDTEVILHSYEEWGKDCLEHFRGMFAFAIWDNEKGELFCARDCFGIKPFYYTIVNDTFYFASEAKSLMPFLPKIETNEEALQDYLTFQFTLGEKTLFQGVKELLPAHRLSITNKNITIKKYWEVYYNLDWEHNEEYFINKLQDLMEESVSLHLRSDVPVGVYVSGGVDSSLIAAMATKHEGGTFTAFTGKFTYGDGYDESKYARDLTKQYKMNLNEIDITSNDFIDSIRKVIYHLDMPVAGPGSFPQYQVSKLASKHRKVVLGGQGGDEIFGGYTRYLVAYFEQCIKGAIEGSLNNGNYIVTYESIIDNLRSLKNYKPMIKQFWSNGLFEDLHKRYFKLIDRSVSMENEIELDNSNKYSPYNTYIKLFLGDNVNHQSYFDLMTHFDFKTLLPALLQVEDRMSMAHGLEARVPFLDHPLIEFAATIPANIKFKDGKLKRLLPLAFNHLLPKSIVNRKDKMGFPVPLNEWMKGELYDFICDIFNSNAARNRKLLNSDNILNNLSKETKFSRKTWGLLSLELWNQEFHDKENYYKKLL